MTDRPTIHLTNFSSRKLHGPGRVFTIMAKPRTWEHGAGKVEEFIPPVHALRQVQDGAITFEQYAAILRDAWSHAPVGWYAPGVLTWCNGNEGGPVLDGDTLCCACARGAPCHRQVAVPFLLRAGWRVVLDGVEAAL